MYAMLYFSNHEETCPSWYTVQSYTTCRLPLGRLHFGDLHDTKDTALEEMKSNIFFMKHFKNFLEFSQTLFMCDLKKKCKHFGLYLRLHKPHVNGHGRNSGIFYIAWQRFTTLSHFLKSGIVIYVNLVH